MPPPYDVTQINYSLSNQHRDELFHIMSQFCRIPAFVILHFVGGGAIMTMVFYIMRFYAYAVLSEYLSLRTSPQTGVAIPKIDGDCHVAALLAMTELIILC